MNNAALTRYALTGAFAFATIALFPSLALAGKCPADKTGINVRAPDKTPGQGVTDKVLASTDLGKEAVKLKNHLFRFRRLVVQPGGVVPWHSHADRPALIYIESGEIYEYASTCSVPILHKAGDVTAETHITAHWWKNTGKVPTVILAADIFPEKGDPHKM